MSDSPSAPPAPNYAAAAAAQGAANQQAAITTAQVSNPNIITPYGNQTVTWGNGVTGQGGGAPVAPTNGMQSDPASTAWRASQISAMPGGFQDTAPDGSQFTNTTGGDPTGSAGSWTGGTFGMGGGTGGTTASGGALQPTVTQTLSPEQQALYKGQTGLSQQLLNLGSTYLPKVSDQIGTPIDSGNARAATDKAYQAFKSRLDPQWAQNDQLQASQLANQGIAQGSEAYNNAERTYGQQKNDAYQQAGVAAQQFAPQTQQMDIAGQSNLLNQLNAIRTGSQVQTPQFQPYSGSNVAPAPVFGGAQAAGQAAQNMYNVQQGATNSSNAGLYGLGGAALTAAAMFSDRRLKSNIRRIGTHPSGIPWYAYEIAGIPTEGVMADEAPAHAVHRLPSGYLAVDYGAL